MLIFLIGIGIIGIMAITGTLMSVNYLFLYKALECLT